MPVYSYKCLKCGRDFEDLSIAGREKNEIKCPSCGDAKVNKTFSSFSVGKGTVKKSPPPCAGSCPGGGCSLEG